MFSIFYTSFCGSTLLASLLSNPISTLMKPQCTFNCIEEQLNFILPKIQEILANKIRQSLKTV